MKRSWGEKWNEHTHAFEASWYDTEEFILDRPFSSKEMILNSVEAKELYEVLGQFLAERARAAKCGVKFVFKDDELVRVYR